MHRRFPSTQKLLPHLPQKPLFHKSAVSFVIFPTARTLSPSLTNFLNQIGLTAITYPNEVHLRGGTEGAVCSSRWAILLSANEVEPIQIQNYHILFSLPSFIIPIVITEDDNQTGRIVGGTKEGNALSV